MREKINFKFVYNNNSTPAGIVNILFFFAQKDRKICSIINGKIACDKLSEK